MEKARYIGEAAATLWITKKMKPEAARAELSVELTKLHCKLFKTRYSKRCLPPDCITHDLHQVLPDDSSDESDEEESDEELCL